MNRIVLKLCCFVILAASSVISSCDNGEAQARAVEQQRIAEEKLAQEQQELQFKNSITKVLSEDAGIASVSHGSATIQAQEMRKIDISQCPADFSTAYVDHIHAWEFSAKVQRALNELNSNENEGKVIADQIWAELFGTGETPIADAVELDDKLKEQAEIASGEIKSTFNKVEHIAVSYGAVLPN
jgi:uncharacterized membrane-anchored protein YjiN (DUF445 family)